MRFHALFLLVIYLVGTNAFLKNMIDDAKDKFDKATEKVKDIGGDVMKGDFSSIKQMGACATKFTKDSCNTYTEHDCYWNKPDGTLSKTVLKMHPAGGFVKGVCAAWERTEGCAYDTEDKCIRDEACMYSSGACKSAGLFGLGFELWMWCAAGGVLIALMELFIITVVAELMVKFLTKKIQHQPFKCMLSTELFVLVADVKFNNQFNK